LASQTTVKDQISGKKRKRQMSLEKILVWAILILPFCFESFCRVKAFVKKLEQGPIVYKVYVARKTANYQKHGESMIITDL